MGRKDGRKEGPPASCSIVAGRLPSWVVVIDRTSVIAVAAGVRSLEKRTVVRAAYGVGGERLPVCFCVWLCFGQAGCSASTVFFSSRGKGVG